MKKAITVTQQAKALNPNWLGGTAVGAIKEFNQNTFPTTWNVMDEEELRHLTNFKTRTNLHELAGFYPVENPVIDPATEKIGTTLSFDAANNKFVYNKVALTAEEQAAYAANQETQEVENEVGGKEADGQEEMRYIFRRLKKLQLNGTLTPNQYNQSRAILFDALLPLYFGQWDIAETKLLALTMPGNQTLANVLTAIITRISNYVLNGIRDDEE